MGSTDIQSSTNIPLVYIVAAISITSTEDHTYVANHTFITSSQFPYIICILNAFSGVPCYIT